jgi:thiamine kinase-like enzyme
MDKHLTEKFKGLYKQNSKELNNLFFIEFIKNNLDKFIEKWIFLLNDNIINKLKLIANKYNKIQNKLSEGKLTLCHGDFKSPNIFYCCNNEPYFIDWQYICEGKGIQDIIFFMIESFESEVIKNYYNIIIDYYYNKIIDNNNKYDKNEYYNDIMYSISYFPMLVALWFGNINQDELIDKNFPFIFIKKFIYFIDNYLDDKVLLDL